MLLVKSSTLPGAGKGLFTKVQFRKGDRIVEYKGRIVQWKDVKHTDGHNSYLLKLSRTTAIDARPLHSGKGRYANDAMGLTRVRGLRNNAAYFIYGNKCFIEATRNIEAGEEIFVAYGSEFWNLQKKLLAPGPVAIQTKPSAAR